MFKHVFHHCLKTVLPLNSRQISVCSTQCCSTLKNAIVRHKPVRDPIVLEIKYTSNATEILEIVEKQNLTANQTVFCLNGILKHEKSHGQPSRIKDHPAFEQLCQKLRKNIHHLPLNETLKSIKILSFLGVPSHSRVMTTLLSLVRNQMNDLTLHNIMWLQRILRKMEKTSLTEALISAMPVLFQLQLPLKLDRDNVRELLDCLFFVAHNDLPTKTQDVVIAALTAQSEIMTATDAAYALKDMSLLKKHLEEYDNFVLNCFAILNAKMDNLNFKLLDMVLRAVCNGKILKHKKVFYNEEFYRNCAKVAIEQDKMLPVFSTLLKFNNASYVDQDLIDFFVTQLTDDLVMLETARPNFIFTTVGTFSTVNHLPPDWTVIKPQLLKNPVFEAKKVEFPWFSFILDLIVVDIWRPDLIERVFQPDFLQQFFEKGKSADYTNLLILYQTLRTIKKDQYVRGPMPDEKYLSKGIILSETNDNLLGPALKNIYHNFTVLSQVKTRLGHTIHHVVVFNDDDSTKIDDFQTVEDLLEKGLKVVGVVVPPRSHFIRNVDRLRGIYALQIKTLEAILPVAVVSSKVWTEMPEKEQFLYLDFLIREKIEKY